MEKQKNMKNVYLKYKKYIPNKQNGAKLIKTTLYILFIDLIFELAIWQYNHMSHMNVRQGLPVQMQSGPMRVSETDIFKDTIAEILKSQGSDGEKIKKIRALLRK